MSKTSDVLVETENPGQVEIKRAEQLEMDTEQD
jgi:hypothetical protein